MIISADDLEKAAGFKAIDSRMRVQLLEIERQDHRPTRCRGRRRQRAAAKQQVAREVHRAIVSAGVRQDDDAGLHPGIENYCGTIALFAAVVAIHRFATQLRPSPAERPAGHALHRHGHRQGRVLQAEVIRKKRQQVVSGRTQRP